MTMEPLNGKGMENVRGIFAPMYGGGVPGEPLPAGEITSDEMALGKKSLKPGIAEMADLLDNVAR